LWATIGIVCEVGGVWPEVEMRQTYRGRSLLLRPDTEDRLASVNLEVGGSEDADSAFLLLRRFLSAATWGAGYGFREHIRLGGSPCPLCGRGPLVPQYIARPGRPQADPVWAPEPSGSRALLALALYREGVNERSHIFQYLSFFKVLEILAKGKREITALAVRHLDKARSKSAPLTDQADRPTTSNSELARHLYEDGRCAIAHAHSQPLIDPDDPRNTRDIAKLVHLVRSLAEVVIEEEFKIPRWWPPDWRPEWSLVSPAKGG
jgi:hypothetical protein